MRGTGCLRSRRPSWQDRLKASDTLELSRVDKSTCHTSRNAISGGEEVDVSGPGSRGDPGAVAGMLREGEGALEQQRSNTRAATTDVDGPAWTPSGMDALLCHPLLLVTCLLCLLQGKCECARRVSDQWCVLWVLSLLIDRSEEVLVCGRGSVWCSQPPTHCLPSLPLLVDW